MDSRSLLAWSDDLFLHGHHLSAWICDYIDLEESLAIGSIAQELLAHSAALMGTAGLTAQDRDRRIFTRPADEWYPSASSRLVRHDWADTVARSFVLNRAMLELRDEIPVPARPQAQQLAEVITAEQEVHRSHWERWIALFATNDALRTEFGAALADAASDAVDLFGPPPGAEPVSSDVHRRWWAGVVEVVGRHGHAVPSMPDEPQPRVGGAAFAEDVIADLRSARNPDGSTSYLVYE